MGVFYYVWISVLIGMCYGNQQDGSLEDHNLTNAETTQLLDELLKNMDYRVRPNVDGGPVNVKIGFYAMSFGSVDDIHMDYSIDLFLHQWWYDSRLVYTNTSKPLTINAHLIDQIWKPDLFFPRSKKAEFHEVTAPNRMITLYPDGQIMYSMRLTLTLACHMDLTNFPLDHQECEFKLESYAYRVADMTLEWEDDKPIELEPGIELPQFDLHGVKTTECVPQKYKIGLFPCLKALFSLHRQYGYHLLQTFIPSILIVMISWISFWINMDAVPARVTLGVTTVLTMSTQLSGSKASIPKVSYPKAIDMWMSMCMCMVFGALIEYAFVNAVLRHEKKKEASSKKTDGDQDEECGLTNKIRNGHGFVFKMRNYLNTPYKAKKIDKMSRIMYPLFFLIFNLIYWPYFTSYNH